MKKLLASLLLVANVAQANWLPSFNAVRAWVPSWNATKEAASSLATLASENKVTAATIGGAAIVTTAIAVATIKHNRKPTGKKVAHVGSEEQQSQSTAATSSNCTVSPETKTAIFDTKFSDIESGLNAFITNSITADQLKTLINGIESVLSLPNFENGTTPVIKVMIQCLLGTNNITLEQLKNALSKPQATSSSTVQQPTEQAKSTKPVRPGLLARAWQNTKAAVTSSPVRYGAAAAVGAGIYYVFDSLYNPETK